MSESGSTSAAFKNRLASSRSVYLLQHAGNPVDWHPWGAEAIASARARGVPLFVSIGYSTCYWCHVMERESFEDAATAQILNGMCVPVKVDREERPDIDEVMMTACQIFTQMTEGRPSGGWPLNVFLDPQTLQPFFCGTYFPPREAFGRVSFTKLLNAVEAAWKSDRAGIEGQAQQLGAMVKANLERTGGEGARDGDAAAGAASPGDAVREVAALEGAVVATLMRMHDPANGGFGGAPKFPTPSYPGFLMSTRGEDPAIARALRLTLDRMAIGGIFDQIGGGFHRYSVDGEWTVPHFEKMLYDNAQLASLYARAAAAWGDEFYAQVAQRTLDYVLREMTGAEGQFYSAQDAEVDAREGSNYIWTAEEVGQVFKEAGDPEVGELAVQVFGLDRGPNFVDPHHPGAAPASVLRLRARPEVLARELGMPAEELDRKIGHMHTALFYSRAKRPQPITDDKTIASWNGLMIEAFATSGTLLGMPKYTAAGARAAEFVLDRMRTPDGGLYRIWRGGDAAVPAFLEDYACMCNALLALGDRAAAAALAESAHARFAAPATGAWFDVAEGQNELWVRPQNLDDGAVPCGTSSMLRALVQLGGVHAERAERLIGTMAASVREQPATACGTVLAAIKLATLRTP